jgi:hypothetical protein
MKRKQQMRLEELSDDELDAHVERNHTLWQLKMAQIELQEKEDPFPRKQKLLDGQKQRHELAEREFKRREQRSEKEQGLLLSDPEWREEWPKERYRRSWALESSRWALDEETRKFNEQWGTENAR